MDPYLKGRKRVFERKMDWPFELDYTTRDIDLGAFRQSAKDLWGGLLHLVPPLAAMAVVQIARAGPPGLIHGVRGSRARMASPFSVRTLSSCLSGMGPSSLPRVLGRTKGGAGIDPGLISCTVVASSCSLGIHW